MRCRDESRSHGSFRISSGESSESTSRGYDLSVPPDRALGWASIGIGLAEIAAPKRVQGMLGLQDRAEHRGILRMLGIREILHGISILTETQRTSRLKVGIWSRVAGDMLDTAVLAAAAEKTKNPGSFAATSAAVLAIGVMDMLRAAR